MGAMEKRVPSTSGGCAGCGALPTAAAAAAAAGVADGGAGVLVVHEDADMLRKQAEVGGEKRRADERSRASSIPRSAGCVVFVLRLALAGGEG
jgi:hypothetical protein